MRSTDQMLIDGINARRPTLSFVGTFRYANGARAVCDALGGQLEADFAGVSQPSPGESVQIEMRNGSYLMLGPTRLNPSRGTVVAVAAPGEVDPTLDPVGDEIPEPEFDENGNPILPPVPPDTTRCVVESDGRVMWLPFTQSYTPYVGHVVAIQWGETGGLVLGRVSAVPTAPGRPSVGVPPPTQASFRPTPFHASQSGTFESGGWRADGKVLSTGGAFAYGAALTDTIPDDATIVATRLYLTPEVLSGGPASLRLHELSALTDAPAWVGDPWEFTPVEGWQEIPVAFADWLKSNPGGIGFDAGADVFSSVTADPLCGALDVAYMA
ncbi:hypothetical protein [Pseudoclavibacter terrae]|uniref:Uncharacterized protein n=1 Tax=Pseudoclavibacter terrae TaxID=1530195 RepID=A0A7J5B6U7_9MICO|nr:hypothetical protein [Pseudoclavibacter terrae]KAB1639872.1 hypothetical protein F8O03_06065 [Pseudoclavibacter terrae]